MSGEYVLQLAMLTCRQSARVLDKMENFLLKSKGVPQVELQSWISDTGIPSRGGPREPVSLCFVSCI